MTPRKCPLGMKSLYRKTPHAVCSMFGPPSADKVTPKMPNPIRPAQISFFDVRGAGLVYVFSISLPLLMFLDLVFVDFHVLDCSGFI